MGRIMNVRICYRLLLSFFLVALGSGFNPIQLLAGRSSSISRCRSTNTRKLILSPEQTAWRNKESFILSRLDGPSVRYAKSEDADDSDDDEEDEDITVDDDWRAFRAKLVMGEKNTSEEDGLSQAQTSPSDEKLDSTSSVGSIDEQGTENLIDDDADLDGIGSIFREEFADPVKNESEAETSKNELTPLDPSQWAYDSGDVIEQGAVILGGIEQEFGFGLRQQYFHKTVMLVLDHSPMFTKGIILNRPTDLMLEDDINQGVKWRVWFGGDVEGMNAQHPDILCLHSLNDERATKASIPVMKDIQWTTFDNAKKLVKAGIATVSDFWVFVGYAGWGPDQLKGELERNSWYMVATDSQTLLKELARQSDGADPRDAGLETWKLLMNMIGRSETAKQYYVEFDDLMLKEWAFRNLLSTAAGGGAGRQQRDPADFNTNPELVEQMLSLLEKQSEPSIEGALISASADDRSPFLLQNQEFHKSVVLILKDDKLATIGVILNRPSTKGIDIQVDDLNSGGKKVVTIPMRFGGPYSIQGEESLLWIHRSEALRKSNIGHPIGKKNGIWKCTTKDVMKAVGEGIVPPEEFLVVSGVSVWPKQEGTEQGIQGELELRNFEMVPEHAKSDTWSIFLKQQVLLKKTNFIQSLKLSENAWSSANPKKVSAANEKQKLLNPLLGIGENFDEDDDSYVFKSNYKVSQLSDDALRGWCAVFLLGVPNFDV
eukprot:CAMPEP_0116103516 /NCGR_PEP_ID=MMETSP0327-20121206/13925_1 /TAXON_ID=44447 /ORGANISM="Pseudo-nitzschia delicatissima, Strain B596" /LENGTH=714 /DNA_ID=CAMNT_0003595629 /DNA_START=101 /DNA_END=2245 /DNA_ORIENTATION=+